MSNLEDDTTREIADRLRSERPTLTALDLDSIKRRAMTRRAPRTAGGLRGRIAVLTMLAFGFVFSASGAGLAVSGLAGNDQAATAQYGSPPPPPPGGGVLPDEDENPPGDDEVIPEDNDTSPEDVDETRQVQQGAQQTSQLPFTGFAAIPVLLVGIALLTGGFVLRRRTD